MKKFNWGHGISLVLIMFGLFIFYFLYRAITNPNQNDLVTEDYYNKGIEYQNEINALKNAKNEFEPLSINITNELLKFQYDKKLKNIKSGKIYFIKPDNKKYDQTVKLDLDTNSLQKIDISKFVKGYYNIKVFIDFNNTAYQFETSVEI